jgi:pimeloyl-ACP methyl ester carboxylesterase
MKRIYLLLIPVFVVLFFWGSARPVQADAPVFIPGECPFEEPLGGTGDLKIICGTVAVPQFHAEADGPTIELAVVVIKATAAAPASDPLIMAQGGPGGSTIDTYVTALLMKPEALEQRDVILFDQRGTLYSQPALMCDETMQLTMDTLDQDLSIAESNRLYEEALEKCRTRLINEGVDLAAFNSFENAADIDWVRQALGYEQVNYYGVSYGTLLGFHLLRTEPAWLRSVVLDAVVPPDINFVIDAPRNKERSFGLLFASCLADAACNRAYPNLEAEFTELVNTLNANPIRVPVTDLDTMQTYEALVDGDTVVALFFQMLYATDIIPALPRTVYDLKAGNTNFFARILELLVFDRTMSEGMYYAVLCAEDSDYTAEEAELALEGVRPLLADGERESIPSMIATCRNWRTVDLNPLADEPVTSDIPVLLLNGEFDPITPPANSVQAVKTLSNGTSLVFPGMGHGAFLSNPCPTGIIFDFLNNPQAVPDSSCIVEMGAPAYFTPQSVVDFPVILQALNLKPFAAATVLSLLFFAGFLSSVGVVLPGAWLVRKLSNKPARRQTFLVRFAAWLPFLAAVLLGGFILGLTIITTMLVNANNSIIFFGLPVGARAVFVPALLAALVLLVTLGVAVQAWRKAWWSLGGRIYYTLLALSGLIIIVILLLWAITS